MEVPEQIKKIAALRYECRKMEMFAASDAFRAELNDRGYTVTDRKGGYTLQDMDRGRPVFAFDEEPNHE